MPRLQKSIDKRCALLSATLTLINKEGILGASMAKVAKLANVSPATIYLLFENKQDMVNQLYLEVKKQFADHAFVGYDGAMPVKKSFEQIWLNMVDFKLNVKEEASFLAQCDNTPMIDESVRKKGVIYLQPLFDLWARGQKEGIIKELSPYLLYAFTIYPMAFLMHLQCRNICPLNEQAHHDAFQLAWDSIKV